jgi:hypothetical protein
MIGSDLLAMKPLLGIRAGPGGGANTRVVEIGNIEMSAADISYAQQSAKGFLAAGLPV